MDISTVFSHRSLAELNIKEMWVGVLIINNYLTCAHNLKTSKQIQYKWLKKICFINLQDWATSGYIANCLTEQKFLVVTSLADLYF